MLTFMPLFDGGIFSCRVHMIKPEKGIYELLCKQYDLDPAECVFIDDNAKNVEGARSVGITAIHFKDYESASRELEEILTE